MTKERYSLNTPIKLCGEPIHNLIDILHWSIENLVFFKWTFFKNRPRANFILIKSILTVIILSIIIFLITEAFNKLGIRTNNEKNFLLFLEKNLYNLLITFLGAISIIYWQTATIFQKKWLYCNELYNKILALDGNDIYHHDLLCNALAIDLLTLDLWAHRSFRDFFRDELNNAISNYKSEYILDKTIEKINNGYLNERDAFDILESHQRKLLEREKTKLQ